MDEDILPVTVPNPSKQCIKRYINHPILTENLQFKFEQAWDLSADMIINTIAKLAQSGKNLSIDEKLTFDVLIMHCTTGAG
jgi:hypothetical protein